MKSFTQLVGMFCLAVLSLVVTTSVRGQEKISASYSIYVKDAVIQTDKYEISPGKSYADEIKGVAAGETDARFELKLENSRFLSLEKTVNGIIESSIKYNNNVFAFYEKTAMVGALPDEGSSPVFESSAYSHFAFLVSIYDQAKGGKQSFSVVIPALQDFINIEIERHGTDPFKIGEQNLTATHYRMAIGKKRETANLWVDNNKVIAIYLASNNRFVIDNGYPQLYDRVKQVINRAM